MFFDHCMEESSNDYFTSLIVEIEGEDGWTPEKVSAEHDKVDIVAITCATKRLFLT